MSDELVIWDVSNEIFKEMIRTMPLTPDYMALKLLANGIPQLDDLRRNGKKYYNECMKHNIIPCSFGTLHSYGGEHGFYWNVESTFTETYPKKIKEASIQGLIIRDKKVHELKVEIGKNHGPKEFKFFQEKVLDSLLEQEYLLDNGEWWFMRNKGAGHCDIVFHRDFLIRGYEISVNSNPCEKEKTLIKWFASLKDKYEK